MHIWGKPVKSQGRIWLSYGITTVRDPGVQSVCCQSAAGSLGTVAVALGPRTHVTGYLTDGNRVYYTMAEGISSRAHLHMALQRTEQLQLDFIKTYVSVARRVAKRSGHLCPQYRHCGVFSRALSGGCSWYGSCRTHWGNQSPRLSAKSQPDGLFLRRCC